LRFDLKKPQQTKLPEHAAKSTNLGLTFEAKKEYATREVFGETLAKLGKQNKEIYALDGDVMNSTFTQTFKKAHPERFVECISPNRIWSPLQLVFHAWEKFPLSPPSALFLLELPTRYEWQEFLKLI